MKVVEQAVRLVRGDTVALEPVRWLWNGFLPAGMLTILGGAPGCGKTTIALSLAATITRGGAWPDSTRCTQPGDVLVVPCTTPAYNMVLSMAGAVVTAEGGALSHAAILARELGIPAVVGAPRALHDIPDGALVEVDAAHGCVRVIS